MARPTPRSEAAPLLSTDPITVEFNVEIRYVGSVRYPRPQFRATRDGITGHWKDDLGNAIYSCICRNGTWKLDHSYRRTRTL